MGRGDKKTKKGKITKGSFGKSRPKKKKKKQMIMLQTTADSQANYPL